MKKRTLIKALSLALAAILLCISFAGCGQSSPVAVSIGDVKITSNMYCYWMSRYKAMFLYSYTGQTTDNQAFWTGEIAEGVTVGSLLENIALSNIMTNAVCLKLFDDYGLQLTNDMLNSVDQTIDTMIQSAGSKASLNSALSAFGVNTTILKEIYIAEMKINMLNAYLFGDNGPKAITDAEMKAYYEENYYRVKHLLVRTDVNYVKDENGEYVADESTGTVKTVELTDAEKEAKIALAKDLQARLASGEEFDTLLKEYTEDTNMIAYEDGYYIHSGSTFLPQDIITAVPEMKVGEFRMIESDIGYHIIRRYDLKTDAYKTEPYATAMFSDLKTTLQSVKMQELIAPFADQVITDQTVIDDYPLVYCTPNFYY